MATWANDGFAGELFNLAGAFMPPPPGVQAPSLWGVEAHVAEAFGATGANPSIARETVVFDFASVEDAVTEYADDFGPFVIARGALAPQGRWEDFLARFGELVGRFDTAPDGAVRIASEYFVVSVER